MFAFRVLLALIAGTVLVYTGFVAAAQGWNFLPAFLKDIAAVTWAGQFNLDLGGLLLLSALWLAWRHRFAPTGIALALLVLVGGSPVLCTYLFVVSLQTRGDVKSLLLGGRAPS